jgi:N-acetyl-anhydromuramyl-L-alanine amidase AmpD
MASAILVDGREVACGARVTASVHYRFSALGKRTDTRAVCWHWTGGQGLAPQVFRTLRERGLSVHFCIDPDGAIMQYADASLRCSHAGLANSFTIGVEMTNPGTRLDVIDGFQRERLVDAVHGRAVRYQAFTAPQLTSARALARSISLAYGLPLDIPREKDGGVIRRVLTPAEREAFRGHAGHFHFSPEKTDPGPRFLDSLVPAKAARS